LVETKVLSAVGSVSLHCSSSYIGRYLKDQILTTSAKITVSLWHSHRWYGKLYAYNDS